MRRILSFICVAALLYTAEYVKSAYSLEECMVISGKMTYGMIKKHIEIGKTTQADILKLLGPPDKMTMDNGNETWVYDRYRVTSGSSPTSGFGTIVLVGVSENKSENSTQTKALTINIKYGTDNVVRNYSMREGGY